MRRRLIVGSRNHHGQTDQRPGSNAPGHKGLILFALCPAAQIIEIDVTTVNVALLSLVRQLRATTSLQTNAERNSQALDTIPPRRSAIWVRTEGRPTGFGPNLAMRDLPQIKWVSGLGLLPIRRSPTRRPPAATIRIVASAEVPPARASPPKLGLPEPD
jgi:hypothetical protein